MRSTESMVEELFADRIAPCTIKHDILRDREGVPGAYIGLIPRFQAIGTDQ